MSNYVKSVLLDDEQVLYSTRISLWSQFWTIFIGVITIPLLIGLIILIIVAIRYYTTELAITNKRLITKFGFLSISTMEMNLSKIESIQVDQSIFGRIFNYGHLVISGAGTPQAPIPNISKPLEFRNSFIKAQDKT